MECFDPWVDEEEVKTNYQINQISFPKYNEYDAIILSVAHKKIIALGADKIREFGKPTHLYDLSTSFQKTRLTLGYRDIDGIILKVKITS